MLRRTWMVLAGACGALGCHEPRRAPNATGDAATAALCGNGTVDPGEVCDDGSASGTAASLCSVQCRLAEYPVAQWPSVPLDLTPTRISRVFFGGNHATSGVAYTDFAASAVHVMPETGAPYWQTGVMPPVVTFPTTAPPVALGSLQQLPVWIENGSTANSFRLFYGTLGANDTPVAREIPYPFPSGTRPRLIQSAPSVSAVLVDQDPSSPHDLLVAVLVLRADNSVETTTFRTGAPAGSMSVVGTTTTFTDATADVWEQQLVVFFDNPGKFVSLRIAQPYPDLQLGNAASTYTVSEIARGAWPFHVISATSFNEFCTAGQGAPSSQLRSPAPLAVLTSAGDILVWQFTHGLADGETFVSPYASPGPAARTLGAVEMQGVWGIWALATDGTLKMYGDSDCTNLESPGLAPLSFDLAAGQPVNISDRGLPSLSYDGAIEFVLGASYFSNVFGESAF